eukprot:TRINITY_DN1978_c0_g1_i1.p1 TRINITY_DN1978_c0_g1~~TRINITY_DN1978_c0_g1_i1.p1  ORF type:complete len:195 (-),score=48.29 TRINITY_DN1978_c0_g1_i1:92-676(-)
MGNLVERRERYWMEFKRDYFGIYPEKEAFPLPPWKVIKKIESLKDLHPTVQKPYLMEIDKDIWLDYMESPPFSIQSKVRFDTVNQILYEMSVDREDRQCQSIQIDPATVKAAFDCLSVEEDKIKIATRFRWLKYCCSDPDIEILQEEFKSDRRKMQLKHVLACSSPDLQFRQSIYYRKPRRSTKELKIREENLD